MTHVVHRFERRFGRAPTIGATAPGRVNLIGEHTDYNDGLVMPFAIDRAVTMVAAPAAADDVTVWALDVDGPGAVVRAPAAVAAAPGPHGHANLVFGVIEQFRALGTVIRPMDIAFTSTIPQGAGLSSSAAIEVATALLVASHCAVEMDTLELALLCQRAEHAFGGVPCGIMDMLVIAAAHEGHALLLDCRDHCFQGQRLPETLSILVADTGVRRTLSDGAYAERRDQCRVAARALGLDSLRDATVEAIGAAGLDQVHERRALHVVTENTRVLLSAAALRAGDLATLGNLMTASHVSLRDLYEVSCPELDRIADAAKACAGVYGARMTGAGFGGCAIIACDPATAGHVKAHLAPHAHSVFETRPSAGARLDDRALDGPLVGL